MEIRPGAQAPIGAPDALRQAARTAPMEAPDPGRAAPGPQPGMPGYDEGPYSLVGDEGDYGGMPWDAAPAASRNEPLFARAAELGMPPEGVDLMRRLEGTGKLDWSSGGSETLGEQIVWRLENRFVDADVAQVLMGQILDPDTNIKQIGPSTCAAATAQKAMALNDPGLYFVTAADMVRGGGGNLPDGSQAVVSEANRTYIKGAGFGPEARVDATVQAALMDFANGVDGYDLARDKSLKADGATYDGLGQQAVTRLNRATLRAPTLDPSAALADFQARLDEGRHQRSYDHSIDGSGQQDEVPTFMEVVMEHLRGSREKSFPGVFVPMRTPDGAHMTMVKDVDEKKRTVSVIDATGAPRSLTFDQFVAQVSFAPTDGDGGIGAWSGYGTSYGASGGRR